MVFGLLCHLSTGATWADHLSNPAVPEKRRPASTKLRTLARPDFPKTAGTPLLPSLIFSMSALITEGTARTGGPSPISALTVA